MSSFNTRTISLSKKLSLHILPILSDNYCYFLINHQTNQYAMVDPSDSKKIHQYLKSTSGQALFDQKRLSTILTTHKHWDHAGGNLYFVKNLKEFSSSEEGLQVVGNGECEGVNQVLKNDLESFTIFDDKTLVQAYHTPCHTTGHVCYIVKTSEEGGDLDCLFCGDTFFVGGCGKFFEGTAQQMFDNIVTLNKEIKDPKRMLLCCGHEYTVKNMQFIVDKISDTETTRHYLNKYKNLIENGQESSPHSTTPFHGTVPSTWQDETEYNPYFKAALLNTEARREYFNKMVRDGSLTEDDLKSWESVHILQTVRDLKDKY